MLDAARVPKKFIPVFQKAQEYVKKYFKNKIEDPSKGTIEIFGERYILVRAASMSVDFFETVKNLYKDIGEKEALNVAAQLLFDIAHAIGKEDAKNFHKKMHLKDPIEKLSAGPIHFSHSGWAFVDISSESNPSPNESYYLIYDHPYSFEADAWIKAGKISDVPMCVMNAGYSSGWCEESFGVTLVASEIMCRAKGDEACRFIMAHPAKIENYIREYIKKEPALAARITRYEIPGFFQRKQIEEERNIVTKALKENEEKYRLLVENQTDFIVRLNPEVRFLFVSPSCCELFREKEEGFLGKEFISIMFEEDKPLAIKAMNELYRLPHAAYLEHRAITRYGPKWLAWSFKSILDSNNIVTAILGVGRDITEQKKLSEARQKSEQKFKDLIETTTDLVWEVTQEGLYSYVSPKIKDILGYEVMEVLGKSPFSLMPEEEAKKISKFFKDRLIKREPFYGLENTNRHKDGHLVILETNAIPIFDKKGEFIGYRGIDRDITQRKKAEEALRASEEKYKTVVNSAPDTIVVVDLDGKIDSCNPQIEKLTGYKPEELQGKSFFELMTLDPKDLPILKRLYETLRRGENIENYMLEIKHRNQEKRWIRVKTTALKSQAKPAGFLIISEDITENKIMRDELARKTDDLLSYQKTTTEKEQRLSELKNRTNELQDKIAELEKKLSRRYPL